MSDYVEIDIGEFPKDWDVRKLKDVIIKAKSGGTPRRNVPEYWNGNIPFAKIQDITKSGKYLYNTEEFITEKGLENSNAWIVPKDSLLLTIYGSLGFVAINKIPVATNQAIIGIIPNKNIIDTEFLYYWYLYFKPYWSKFIKKGTQPNLTLEIVLNSSVPILPLEEQKKIVELLQKATDIYYTLKDYIIQIRNSTETITKVIRKELLTKGIGHRDYVETDIGEFPKDWEVRRLNEIAIIRSGFSERKRDENSKVIHLRPDNIDNETDRIVFHRIVYIPESPKIERYLLRHLDIVLVNTNGSIDHIGKLGIIDMPLNQKITFSNHLTAIRIVSKDVEPYYIYYLLSWYHLNGSFKKVVKNQAGKWNLNLDTIRNLLIPLPPLEEQKKIVELLQKVDELIIRFNDFLQNLEDEANTLYKSILRLALTGKLTEDWRRQIILLRSVVIPYLVYQASKIKGRPVYMTELMKYLFLLQKEYNINLAYNFEPYKYGPFTPQLYKDLEELKDRIEVKEVKDNVDKSLITSKELPQVNQDIANAVNDLINRFGNKDLKELLSYVYKKYPEYTVKSELNLDEFLK
ncbi:restriction endonuclease subunit S [Saccharolobus islandicus]|nr:restriction endonuclease subunit S [Sulfolobus islandicus]